MSRFSMYLLAVIILWALLLLVSWSLRTDALEVGSILFGAGASIVALDKWRRDHGY